MKYASAATATALLCLAAGAQAAELPSIRLAQSQFATGAGQLPLTIAQEKGFFTREGVRVEVVKETRSNAGAIEQGYIPAIERNAIAEVDEIPNAQFIEAVLNGSDGVGISAVFANPVYSLVVRPEINSYADLKGKEITLTAPWDAITLMTRKLLEMHGVGAMDVRFKSIAGTEGRLACMKAGECAAAPLGKPADLEALKMGYHRLGATSEAGPAVFNMQVVTREWAKNNRDTLVRFLRGEAATMRFIHDPANRTEVRATLARLIHQPDDVVNETMDELENPRLMVLTRNAEIDMAGFRRVLQLVAEYRLTDKTVPPAERFVDQSYAKAAGIQ